MRKKKTPAKGAHRRLLVQMRAIKVMQLYASYYGTQEEIAQHPDVQLSKSRVGVIIRECMEDAKKEMKDFASYSLTRRLHSLNEIKREMRDQMLKPCPICRGEGEYPDQQGTPTPCSTCAATGRFYEADVRRNAAIVFTKVLMDEAKLLGETENSLFDGRIRTDFYDELATLTNEQLEEYIDLYDTDGIYQQRREPLELDAGDEE
jgi:hypothetical protein